MEGLLSTGPTPSTFHHTYRNNLSVQRTKKSERFLFAKKARLNHQYGNNECHYKDGFSLIKLYLKCPGT